MDSPTAKVVTTITLAPALRDRLDHAAEQMDRSRSWVAGRAIAQFLARIALEPIPSPASAPARDHVGALGIEASVSAAGVCSLAPAALSPLRAVAALHVDAIRRGNETARRKAKTEREAREDAATRSAAYFRGSE